MSCTCGMWCITMPYTTLAEVARVLQNVCVRVSPRICGLPPWSLVAWERSLGKSTSADGAALSCSRVYAVFFRQVSCSLDAHATAIRRPFQQHLRDSWILPGPSWGPGSVLVQGIAGGRAWMVSVASKDVMLSCQATNPTKLGLDVDGLG